MLFWSSRAGVKYHSNVPGALCASEGRKGLFQLNTRIEARDSCVPGTMARQPFRGEGEPPKEQPPAWAAYPGPWENILRTVTKYEERYPDASSSGGASVALCALSGLFPSACVRVSRTQEENRRKKDSTAAHAGGGAGAGGLLTRRRLLRKAARRTNRVRAWWNARNVAARALAWNAWAERGMRGVRREKHLRGLRQLRQDRGGKPVLQYGMVPAAAAHCHHAGAHHKRGVFFTVYRHCCGRPAVCEFQL